MEYFVAPLSARTLCGACCRRDRLRRAPRAVRVKVLDLNAAGDDARLAYGKRDGSLGSRLLLKLRMGEAVGVGTVGEEMHGRGVEDAVWLGDCLLINRDRSTI
jgi:hypothetical protein